MGPALADWGSMFYPLRKHEGQNEPEHSELDGDILDVQNVNLVQKLPASLGHSNKHFCGAKIASVATLALPFVRSFEMVLLMSGCCLGRATLHPFAAHTIMLYSGEKIF